MYFTKSACVCVVHEPISNARHILYFVTLHLAFFCFVDVSMDECCGFAAIPTRIYIFQILNSFALIITIDHDMICLYRNILTLCFSHIGVYDEYHK